MAVIERAGMLVGRRVVVIGVGMLGLTAVAAASSAGAASVVAVDPHRARRGMAERFGASEVQSSTVRLKDCDTLLEFSGSSAALQEGLRALDVQGVAVLAGPVAPAHLHHRCVQLRAQAPDRSPEFSAGDARAVFLGRPRRRPSTTR
ncbi:zinc-binding dehydrogenase [Streptomyces shenzhenensis]|uniref:zinc-binding dehydrogenase n=1 Tax=Streptomyces shenzhenensis TaxID=943815 RepID=UPI00380A33DB